LENPAGMIIPPKMCFPEPNSTGKDPYFLSSVKWSSKTLKRWVGGRYEAYTVIDPNYVAFQVAKTDLRVAISVLSKKWSTAIGMSEKQHVGHT